MSPLAGPLLLQETRRLSPVAIVESVLHSVNGKSGFRATFFQVFLYTGSVGYRMARWRVFMGARDGAFRGPVARVAGGGRDDSAPARQSSGSEPRRFSQVGGGKNKPNMGNRAGDLARPSACRAKSSGKRRRDPRPRRLAGPVRPPTPRTARRPAKLSRMRQGASRRVGGARARGSDSASAIGPNLCARGWFEHRGAGVGGRRVGESASSPTDVAGRRCRKLQKQSGKP